MPRSVNSISTSGSIVGMAVDSISSRFIESMNKVDSISSRFIESMNKVRNSISPAPKQKAKKKVP